MAAVSGKATRVVLHLYDHCPYCVRVELFLAWRSIPYERVVYGYGNESEEFGPKKLLGKKQLPVAEIFLLQESGDGEAEERRVLMPESLDIIDFFAARGNNVKTLKKATGAASAWVKTLKPSQRILCRPRIIEMPVFDWAKPEDVAYAKAKYTRQGFDYDAALKQSSEMKAVASKRLEELSVILPEFANVNAGRSADNDDWCWTMDDILLLPELRTLTCVRGVTWPDNVRAYLERSFEGCKAELYTRSAVE